MTAEAPRFISPSRETVQKVIDYSETDPYFQIPKFDFPDELKIIDVYQREELSDLLKILKKSGLTPRQRAEVKTALRSVFYKRGGEHMTVGEIREMTDKELLGQGKRMGKKKSIILRRLFGKIPDESDFPTPTETLSFYNLNEDELAKIKLELGERLLADWEHILNLPRLEIEDEAEPRRVEEIFSVLRSQGWTKGQLAPMSGLLSEISQFTVGEIRSMSDDEILEIEGIGLKRLVTIRILFGQA